MRQLPLIPKPRSEHGGEKSRGRRKTRRPFDAKRALHLVLRSSRARGRWNLLHPDKVQYVDQTAYRLARKWDVRLYRYANVGNHLHLLVKARTKEGFQAYLRELTGTLAAAITGARKGDPQGRFWDDLAFSRVISWGREFRSVERYVLKNVFEGAGLLRNTSDRPVILRQLETPI